MASPNAGQGLPPLLLSWTPGCGSSAGRQELPSNVETRPEVGLSFSSPQLVEFDWPAITKTSPTPTCSTTTGAATFAPLRERSSMRYQPPAGVVSFASKFCLSGV